MDYQPLGIVTHYFDRIGVAVIRLEDELYLEDWVLFEGPHTNWEQQVMSMQINYQPIEQAVAGEEVAIQVNTPVHRGDEVFLIVE